MARATLKQHTTKKGLQQFEIRTMKRTLLFFTLFALFANSHAQVKKHSTQNFVNPFKSKSGKGDTSCISPKGNKKVGKKSETETRIETIKGSFHHSLRNNNKVNARSESFEQSLNSYFGLNERHSFKQVKEKVDDLGFRHINYQQLYNNIPIEGSIVMTHQKDSITKINGQVAEFDTIATKSSLSKEQAKELAKKYLKVTDLLNDYPVELIISRISTENGFAYKLAYKARIDASNPFTMSNVYVDATTGEIINNISLIEHADTPATANTLYSGTQTITSDSYNSGYRLRDNTRKIETYDATNADTITIEGGFVVSTDYSNSSTVWGATPLLTSFTISKIAQSWWYTVFTDETPDLYIKVKDGSNHVVYDGRNFYKNNTIPSVSFDLLVYLNNPPYSVEIWDYDLVGGDDFGGSYPITTVAGSQTWTGNGNNGQYVILGTSNNPALDVHWGMEKTYDFYKNVFDRNSYDNKGSVIRNYINSPLLQPQYKQSPNNASALHPPYNVMQYGLGDGSYMKPVVGLDVEGHEYSHMVINHAGNSDGLDSGLVYKGESGALNESFADIFGTSVEFYTRGSNANWTIGEDIMVSDPFLRSMSNPNSTSQPDTYGGTFWENPNCGVPDPNKNDKCGVHTNSGVQNFWFYLLCQGGSGTNDLNKAYSVSGIGINQARQIAYRNLTSYLKPHATYLDAYQGSLDAVEDLYGNPSAQYTAVRAAWYAVGIGNDPSYYCSGTTNLTDANGTFSDGSGSSNYNNNANCKWVIAPSGANKITLNFTSFSTEANFDTVIVYDGPGDTYPKLVTWWGNTLPPVVNSNGGALCVKFKSDASTTSTGWTASYTSTGVAPSCSGLSILSSPTGTVTDGSGAGKYGNNQLCTWLIAPPCAKSVTLSFTQLNTEAKYDGVVVYDGHSLSSPLLGAYSGTTIPSSITSSGGEMLVVFVSDYATTLQGFSANYTSTGSAYCSGTTTLNTTDYGTITDGSSSSDYCNNMDCKWLIQPPQATSITLNFTAFDLEAPSSDGKSIFDAVEVYDGTTVNATLLGRFSGNSLPSAITSSGGNMLVRFYSDAATAKAGWSAYYTSTGVPYCNGNTNLTAQSGTFSDGSSTNKYSNNSQCSWLIQPANASSITLSFSAFDTELNYDGVVVYNGSSNTAPIIGQFTGISIPAPVTSTGGSMYIEFLSDPASRANGWTANYTSTIITGLNGAESTNENLKIYPNPTRNELTISLPKGSSENFNFEFLNQLGQPILSQAFSNSADGLIHLNVSQLPSGIYYLNIKGGEFSASHKFVKQE